MGLEVVFHRSARAVDSADLRGPQRQIAERRREHDPEPPVVYATGFSPVTPRPVAESLFLQKPYHPEDIVKAVSDAAAGRPKPLN